MQNSFKLSTLIWLLAIILVPYLTGDFLMRLGLVIPRGLYSLILAPFFLYAAYRSYRKGLAADAAPEQHAALQARGRRRLFIGGLVSAVVVVLAVAVVMLNQRRLTMESSIEGRYSVKDGSTAEFLPDGTAIFVIGGVQALWRWTKYEGGRLKLEPGPGVDGVKAAVCNYQVNATTLNIIGCEWAMKLTRTR